MIVPFVIGVAAFAAVALTLAAAPRTFRLRVAVSRPVCWVRRRIETRRLHRDRGAGLHAKPRRLRRDPGFDWDDKGRIRYTSTAVKPLPAGWTLEPALPRRSVTMPGPQYTRDVAIAEASAAADLGGQDTPRLATEPADLLQETAGLSEPVTTAACPVEASPMKADRPPAADGTVADWIDRLLTAPLADVRALALEGWQR